MTDKKQREPWFQFRWQSLADRERGQWKYCHGRCWIAVFSWFFRIEWNLWSDFMHLSQEIGGDEDRLQWGVALPPIAIWFTIQLPWDSWLRKRLPERRRETRLSMFEWSIRLVLWGRDDEWRRADPWWVRGVHLDIKDAILGKSKFTKIETLPPQPIEIHLDDRIYEGTAKFERSTWKRRWWFTKTRDSVWIDMKQGHGLPHAGKGENSWDCGDDALCGFGVEGTSVEEAIQHGLKTVGEYRRKWGNATTVN